MPNSLDIFCALADSTRLRIVALVRSMELSVGELAQVLGQSQPRVSRHVKILCDAGMAERRKEGSWVFVGVGQAAKVAPVVAALDALREIEADHWAVADAARLALPQHLRQLADGKLHRAQQRQDTQPCRVCQSAEDIEGDGHFPTTYKDIFI